jgi:hypothetical protein
MGVINDCQVNFIISVIAEWGLGLLQRCTIKHIVVMMEGGSLGDLGGTHFLPFPFLLEILLNELGTHWENSVLK